VEGVDIPILVCVERLSGLKPRSVRGLYAALKAPLFHGGASCVPTPGKVKIKVKGSGQECPLHTRAGS
jgi:hypothetical protein